MAVEFRLLGSFEARIGGVALDVGPARQRCVLVALLVDANAVVTADQLVDRVWGDRVTLRAKETLRSYLSRLRQALAAADDVEIGRRSGGYVLTVDAMAVDLHRFRDLVARARAAGDEDQSCALFEQAVGLRRGEAFAGLDTPWLTALRQTVEAEQLTAELDYTDLRLRRGEHSVGLPELTARAKVRPLDERLAGQLMLALYRCGRQAEALAHFRQVVAQLAADLGVDPSPPLHQLHQQILTADPALAAPTRTSPQPQWAAQCQLPPDIAELVGRDELGDDILARIRSLAAGPAAPIVTISGPPGVGKSAIAVRAAHTLRADFPDGQWYVQLYGTSGSPRQPAEVLANLLRDTGVTPAAIPSDAAERATLWRVRIADRRLLLVLDDAANAAQVEPLLPGTPGSAVIVTSRVTLTALIARHGAQLYPIAGLDPADAHDLLIRILGERRVNAEKAAAREIAGLCGYLPLALRVAAANLAGRSSVALAQYAATLRGIDRLDKLACDDDTQTAVRSAFALSYRALDVPLRRCFRLLGLVAGPDFTVGAAAALVDVSDEHADRMLDRLAGTNLVERSGPDRYRLHDLIRLYAAECADGEEPAAAIHEARYRLYSWYLWRATEAVTSLYQPLPDQSTQDTVDWLNSERTNLVAVILDMAGRERSDDAALLANVLRPYFDDRRHYDEWSAALTACLHANEPADPLNRVRIRYDHAILCLRQSRFRQALTEFEEALHHSRESGAARVLEGNIRNGLGVVCKELVMLDAAVGHLDRALAWQQAEASTNYALRSIIVLNLGSVHAHRGDLGRAVQCLEDSLAITTDDSTRHLYNEALAREILAEVYVDLGDAHAAEEMIRRAVGFYRKYGHRTEEGYSMAVYAAVHRMSGRHSDSLHCGQEALAIAQELNHPGHLANAHNALGTTLRLEGRPDEAYQHHLAALRLTEPDTSPRPHVIALIDLAVTGPETSQRANFAEFAERAATLAAATHQTLLEGEARAALTRLRPEHS
jgi:DNA-binding SARP family transcriptional activator